MSSNHTFECPSCGAPLTVQQGQTEITCPFCGSTVIVPESLRGEPPAPPPQPAQTYFPQTPQVIVIEQPAEAIYQEGSPMMRRRRRTSGCGCLISLLMFSIIAAAAIFATRPVLFARILSQVQSFTAQFNNSPQIVSFTAIPNIVSAGGSVSVVWVTNADSVTLTRTSTQGTQVFSALAGAGQRSFTVAQNETGDITFTLAALKKGQQATSHVVVTIRRR